MLGVSAPELQIDIDQFYRDETNGRAVPFLALRVHIQIVNDVPYLHVITRRLPRLDVAGLNSTIDPRYPEFQRIYSAFNAARKQLFRKIAVNPALKAHRDVVRDTLLCRLDEKSESCLVNQECSLLCLRFLAEDFFQYPYWQFLRRYPSLFHSVSEREFLLKIQSLRREWRRHTQVATINQTARACAQRTQFRFIQAEIEKFAAACIIGPDPDTGLWPQSETSASVQEVVLTDRDHRNLSIEEMGAELICYDRRLIEPIEETIRRVAMGDLETERALSELIEAPDVDTLADLARYQSERAGLPTPQRRQLTNFARTFRKKHKLIKRAIESGVARDAGYSGEEIQMLGRSGRLAPQKTPERSRKFYDPTDWSQRDRPALGEGTGNPKTPEALWRSLLRVSTTVHYDRIAGKVVYAHDPPQERSPLPVVPFHANEGSLRVLYNPGQHSVGEGEDAVLDSDSTLGGGRNFHKDLLAMVSPTPNKLFHRDAKGKSELIAVVETAPVTPRSWFSLPRNRPTEGRSRGNLKSFPLHGPSPDPRVAMRPSVIVPLRPGNYDPDTYGNASFVGNLSNLSGERRLHKLPHDDALEAANRDRIFSDERYGHTSDFPFCPPGIAVGLKYKFLPTPDDGKVPEELRFGRRAKGRSRPPRVTRQEQEWLPAPDPREYVDTPRAGAGEQSTRGLELRIATSFGRRTYAFAWPRTMGLNFELEDWWLTRLLLKVGLALGHKYQPFGWPSNIETMISGLPLGQYNLSRVLNDSLNQ